MDLLGLSAYINLQTSLFTPTHVSCVTTSFLKVHIHAIVMLLTSPACSGPPAYAAVNA